MSTGSQSAGRRLLLLFLLALGVRLVFLAVRHEYVVPAIPGAEAGVMAGSIAEGKGFVTPFGGGSPSTHLPPVYPLLLAGVLKLQYFFSPPSAGALNNLVPFPGAFVFYVALAISVLASAWLPVLTAKLAGAAGAAPRTALVAGVLMCVCPESLRAAGLIWDEALLAACVCGMLLLMLRMLPGATWQSSVSLGVLAGLLSLLNPAATLALPLTWMAGLRAARRPWRQVAAHGVLFVACVVGAGAPWHVRNWLVLDPPARVFVRGNFWLEVWTNLNPITFTEKGPMAAHPWAANGTETLERDGRELTEQEYFAWCRERAVAKLADPATAAAHIARQADAYWLGLAEARRWHRSATIFFLAQGVPFLLGLAGLLLARRQLSRPAMGMLLVFLVVFPLPYYLAGGGARYRHPVDCILYLGIALLPAVVAGRKGRYFFPAFARSGRVE